VRRFWTADEDETLRINYANFPTYLIAHVLNRSERAVYQRAESFGLKKSAAYLASDAAGRIQRGRTDPRLTKTQFRKGQAAWNKGVRGVVGVQPECRATQFKKGQLSGRAQALLKPVGATRIVYGNLERKVTEGGLYPAARWQPVHRLVWEAANGPVPRGHLAVFKPGRHTTHEADITLDRLEVITRAENMRRNSYLTRYPKEVADLIRLRGALNRKINRRTKGEKQAQ
jgi:hypothetical protein